ncbi:hypothetical protein NQ317_015690 [Molorchus minor]|uniref:Uncharacterized protein n=1 Tax=Molorchus minor TaxID=1323400 RepID=A0ABQ9JNL0_9CUCU|nr:hypothetical protein NQ317_015690 [Molorchus minor]
MAKLIGHSLLTVCILQTMLAKNGVLGSLDTVKLLLPQTLQIADFNNTQKKQSLVDQRLANLMRGQQHAAVKLTDRSLSQKTKLTQFAKKSIILKNDPKNSLSVNSTCKICVNSVALGTAGHAETTSTTQGLSKLQAQELILRLTGEERNILTIALQEYQSKLIKEEYEAKEIYNAECSKYINNSPKLCFLNWHPYLRIRTVSTLTKLHYELRLDAFTASGLVRTYLGMPWAYGIYRRSHTRFLGFLAIDIRHSRTDKRIAQWYRIRTTSKTINTLRSVLMKTKPECDSGNKNCIH